MAMSSSAAVASTKGHAWSACLGVAMNSLHMPLMVSSSYDMGLISISATEMGCTCEQMGE